MQKQTTRQTDATKGSGLSLTLAGETLTLLSERAVWWESERTLFLSDLHLGKEATFRFVGIPVPDQTEQLLRRLSALVETYAPVRFVVLGDLIHSRRGRCETTFQMVSNWRKQYPGVAIDLVRGNHDRSAGDPPSEWKIACHQEPHLCRPFALRHEPGPVPDFVVLSGHLHPAVRLSGPARDTLKLPCFLLRDNVLVLPAFSEFVDGASIKTTEQDRVFAICEETVVDLTNRRCS